MSSNTHKDIGERATLNHVLDAISKLPREAIVKMYRAGGEDEVSEALSELFAGEWFWYPQQHPNICDAVRAYARAKRRRPPEWTRMEIQVDGIDNYQGGTSSTSDSTFVPHEGVDMAGELSNETMWQKMLTHAGNDQEVKDFLQYRLTKPFNVGRRGKHGRFPLNLKSAACDLGWSEQKLRNVIKRCKRKLVGLKKYLGAGLPSAFADLIFDHE
jgi:hypothetical protein